MNLLELQLKNIGPFKECFFSLAKVEGDAGFNPDIPAGKHLILTGENGTGKSVIIDAIRTILYGRFASEYLERNILRNQHYNLGGTFWINDKFVSMAPQLNDDTFAELIVEFSNPFDEYPTNFILDYWNSKLSTDKFELKSLELLDEKKIFANPLSGIHKNVDVVKSIIFFDYLKNSENEKDAEAGKFLYDTSVKIINTSIRQGKFNGINRKKLAPVFLEYGNEIEIDKLSSGCIYIMQRMLSLLTKAYAAHVLNHTPISEILSVSGLLLIDEAETHLHPKWQKVLFKNILSIFPNIQIIATTHSPFIVSSLDNAEVIVCKSGKDGCNIENETENYSNKPIEEILRTPLFETDSFNVEISNLLKQRREAIAHGDKVLEDKIKAKLIEKNPEYFKYLNIDNF